MTHRDKDELSYQLLPVRFRVKRFVTINADVFFNLAYQQHQFPLFFQYYFISSAIKQVWIGHKVEPDSPISRERNQSEISKYLVTRVRENRKDFDASSEQEITQMDRLDCLCQENKNKVRDLWASILAKTYQQTSIVRPSVRSISMQMISYSLFP